MSSVIRIRSKSALPKNFTNIELHAHLDDAKTYQDKVGLHFAQSQYENHVLLSAQKFYDKESPLRPSTSLCSLNRRSKMTASTKFEAVSSAFLNMESNNPQGVVMNGLSIKTLRLNDIKSIFDDGKEEKENLKKKMAYLKQKIVEEKNKKAKISLRNCKLMNSSQTSNHNINRLSEQSRKNCILRDEFVDEVVALENDNQKLREQNMKTRELIQKERNSVTSLSQFCSETKKKCEYEKKLLEMWKEKETVSYKSMTNEYMKMNQLKEEKALLLNHIDIDFQNSL